MRVADKVEEDVSGSPGSSDEPARSVKRPNGAAAPGAPLTPEQRSALGKQARARVQRSAHASWSPPADRPDPVVLLEEQAATRVPELVPIRYGRMLVSPFTFYRGAAAIMASDLAATPVSGLTVQACGDAHLSNFGLFASPERELLFDINDFDETLPGPWEWDVKRLGASLAIAGRNNGFSAKQRAAVVRTTAKGYRVAMIEFAAMRDLDVWYSHMRVQQGMPRLRALLDERRVRQVEAVVEKARTKDSLQAFDRLTHLVDGKPRIVSDPPLVVPIEELLTPDQAEAFRGTMDALLRAYRRSLVNDRRHLLEGFRFVDIARKVVGVGSVGTRAWILLLLGRDDEDPLFLQAKEAQASVLAPHVGKGRYANQGQRVVEGQRLMQAASDIFLGWERVTGVDGVARDFYIRQLRDWKGSLAPEAMDPETMGVYGRMCAWTLARGHARSGDRIAIASYLGSGNVFDRALADFAEAYADQNDRDYEALEQAVKEGRVEARTGV
ncbi:MAG: DUF2252 domain-containing protein [Solirubrobacterales bacterium]|jgi:uncharacterized protein (DUF2252 family)